MSQRNDGNSSADVRESAANDKFLPAWIIVAMTLSVLILSSQMIPVAKQAGSNSESRKKGGEPQAATTAASAPGLPASR